MSSVCPSVMLVDHDHIGWKPWKLIVWSISPTSLLFLAQRSSTYSQGNMEKFCGENVHSTPMSITPTSIVSGWIESTENHMILGGGVAVCCLFTFVGTSRGNLYDSAAFLLRYIAILIQSRQFWPIPPVPVFGTPVWVIPEWSFANKSQHCLCDLKWSFMTEYLFVTDIQMDRHRPVTYYRSVTSHSKNLLCLLVLFVCM